MTWLATSILAGKAVAFGPEGERSAIAKHPVEGSVRVGTLGIESDEQADLVHHGGVDKAIHRYPIDHYAFWRAELASHPLLEQPGAFGENIPHSVSPKITSVSVTGLRSDRPSLR